MEVSSGFEYILLTFAPVLGMSVKLLGWIDLVILHRMVSRHSASNGVRQVGYRRLKYILLIFVPLLGISLKPLGYIDLVILHRMV
ncbi:unnamed protein product, partial [Adineta ricciae]